MHARNPKLPYFEESKDKMDSYLSRFEKYAVANKWDRSIWAAYLSALLKGRHLRCMIGCRWWMQTIMKS